MNCTTALVAFIVCGSFFSACLITIICTGTLVAAPALWAQNFQATTCEAISSTLVGARTCSCGGSQNDQCSANFPCYGILVQLNNTSLVTKIYHDESLAIKEEECSYLPECNADSLVNTANVLTFINAFGLQGRSYSCLYNPENPTQVIITRRYREVDAVVSLVVPGVFLGLFGIGTAVSAFVWCANN